MIKYAVTHCWTLLLFATVVSCDNEDLFSSTYELQRLHRTEVEVAGLLNDYVGSLERHLTAVKEYLSSAYPTGLPTEADNVEKYVSNPMNALGMMWRMGFLYHTQEIPRHLANASDILEGLSRIKNRTRVLPTLDNYRDAASSISLLQEAYQLNTTALAYGIVDVGDGPENNYVSDHNPNMREILELGTAACNRGWWDTGLEWYEVGLSKYERGDESRASDRQVKIFRSRVEMAKGIHDQLLEKRGPVSIGHRTYLLPFDEKLRKKKKYREARKNPRARAQKVKRIVAPFSQVEGGVGKLKDNFHELCQKGPQASVYRSPGLDAELHCRFLHHGKPYLRLGPIKMEEKSEQPFVVMFHDIMSETEMEHYRKFAVQNMMRSVTGQGAKAKTSLERTSKQSWMADRVHAFNRTPTEGAPRFGNDTIDYVILRSDMTEIYELPANHSKHLRMLDEVGFRLSLRIQNATGLHLLNPYSAEAYQVANYGMGGQYSTHGDPHGYYRNDSTISPEFDKPYYAAGGDRLATFMVYLSEVEYGGHTVFPLAGLSAKPTKGSALFWLNLHPRGNEDKWTHHGGCPVLVGSKWITNKWVHYHDQFRAFPCGLKPLDKFDTLAAWRREDAIENQRHEQSM